MFIEIEQYVPKECQLFPFSISKKAIVMTSKVEVTAPGDRWPGHAQRHPQQRHSSNLSIFKSCFVFYYTHVGHGTKTRRQVRFIEL